MTSAIEHLQSAFQWTLQTSVQASMFIGLVLLLLFFWGRHLTPGWRMTLGLLVLMRLVIPVLPESSLSYLNLIPHSPTNDEKPIVIASHPEQETSKAGLFTNVPQALRDSSASFSSPLSATDSPLLSAASLNLIASNPVIAPASPSVTFAANPGITSTFKHYAPHTYHNAATNHVISMHAEQPAERTNSASLPPLLTILTGVWLLGITILLLATFLRRNRLVTQIKNQPRLSRDSATAIILDLGRHKMGIRRNIPLLSCPQIQTAAVFGYLRPVILVSPHLESNFTSNEIRDILLHELAHIQRADILWNWLAFTAQILHWFNPLTWVATRRFRADRELACDARVLKQLPANQHSHYGNTLIKIASLPTNTQLNLNPALAPFYHRKSEIKTRITMIANPNKYNKLSHAVLALLLVIICSITFTRAQDEGRDEPREGADKEGRREKAKERDEDRRRPQPERKERAKRDEGEHAERREHTERKVHEDREHEERGRAEGRDKDRPHPPESRGPRGMPPEAREFAERMRQFHMEIGQLHRTGKTEEARAVEEELREFVRDHANFARRMDPPHGPGRSPGRNQDHDPERRPSSPESELHKLHDELARAERDGRREDVEKLRRHIGEVERHHAGRRGHPEREEHELDRRIHHLDQAARNLEEAGMHDQASQLFQQVERLEREQLQREREHLHREREEDHKRNERGRGERGHEGDVERELQERAKLMDQELRKRAELMEKEMRQQAEQLDQEMRKHAEMMDKEMRKQAELRDKEMQKLSNIIERLEEENEQLKKRLRKRGDRD